MRPQTCLCCGAPLSVRDENCCRCGTTVFEYTELKEIRIKDGIVRCLANYEADSYELNKLVNEYAKKLNSIYVFEQIQVSSHPTTYDVRAGDKIVLSNIAGKFDEFIDAMKTHLEIISDFFMERGFYSLHPIHDLEQKLYYDSILYYVKLHETEFKEIMGRYNKEATALSMEQKRMRDNYYSKPSSPVIVANSWTAVFMNEIGSARDRAALRTWEESTNSLMYSYILLCNQTVAEFERCYKQFIQKVKQFIFDRFEEQSLYLEGSATNKSKEKWKELLRAPESLDYVRLLSTAQTLDVISGVVDAFDIDKDELYIKCCSVLKEKLRAKSISMLIEEEKKFINNMMIFFSKSKNDIIKDFLKHYIDKVESAFVDICNALPEGLKSNLPSKENALIEAQALLNSIICPENYLFINKALGMEWEKSIRAKCNLDNSSSTLYEQVLKSVSHRICIANDYLAEKNIALSKLKDQKNQFLSRVHRSTAQKKAKKIANIEQEIRRIEEEFEQKMKEL